MKYATKPLVSDVPNRAWLQASQRVSFPKKLTLTGDVVPLSRPAGKTVRLKTAKKSAKKK
jgi:hypothetical protein